MSLFDKTAVINMCCICLTKSEEFSKTLYNNGLYYKLTVSIPEMRFELLNINQYICDPCADSVNDIYNFRNKCLLNKPIFIDSLIKHKEQQFQIETEKRCAKVAKKRTTEKHPMLIQQLTAPVNNDPELDEYIRNNEQFNDGDAIVIKEESETETESEGEILPDVPAKTKRKRYRMEESVIQSERQKQLEIERQSETQTQMELQRQSEMQTQLELQRQSELQRQLETQTHSPSILPHSPSIIPHSPSILPHSPSIIPHSPSIIPHSPSIIPHSPSIIPHSPSIIPHSPSIIPHSPSVIRSVLQPEEIIARRRTSSFTEVQREAPSHSETITQDESPPEYPKELQTETPGESHTRVQLPTYSEAISERIPMITDVRSVIKTEPEFDSSEYQNEGELQSEIKIEPETIQKFDFLEHSESTETAKSEAFLDEDWMPPETLGNPDEPPRVRKKYPCLECDRSFDEEFQLQLHQVVHITRIQYSCDQCNKTFNHISALNKHRQSQSHNQIKPFQCSKCCAAFSQKSQLMAHAGVHEGIKNYECVECQRTFSSNEYLKKHMLTHTGLRPYKCSMCDKTFTQSSNLSRHERLHEKRGSSLYIRKDVRY